MPSNFHTLFQWGSVCVAQAKLHKGTEAIRLLELASEKVLVNTHNANKIIGSEKVKVNTHKQVK